MKKYMYFCLLVISGISGSLQAQCGGAGCNGNTYVKSSDPNTIEYDNLISTFHSSMLKEASGRVLIWGEYAAANGTDNVLSPTEINSTNYPRLTGTILRYAGGSAGGDGAQFIVLTTDGLFIWGNLNTVVTNSITNRTAFRKVRIRTAGESVAKEDGLPEGVSPGDVKMMFGTRSTLAITTCDGQAWVLSMFGNKNGDGSAQSAVNNSLWHRVKTGNGANDYLTDVVAVRGTRMGLIALTSTGKLYTWGSGTYLGDNSGAASRTYATEMTLPSDWPAGARPKMIGMTTNNSSTPNTYYLLASDGTLYSLGNNRYRELGDFTVNDSRSWIRVKKSPTENMTDIAWISPSEHDSYYSAINALTTDGKLYSWGTNDRGMLGGGGATFIDPTYMPGLDANDVLMAVETGGHTSMVIKQCSQNFGYVGHSSSGSMGNGSALEANAYNYTFFTARVNLCGANTQPNVISKKTCPGATVNLADLHIGNIPDEYELKWYTTSTKDAGTEVTNPAAVGPGTYYAFYITTNPESCDSPASDAVIISEFGSSDPEYKDCSCKRPIETGTPLLSKFGISTKESHADNWPTQVPNGYIVLDASKKGMVITHMTTAQINALTPVTGMIVYDTDAKCIKLYRGDNPAIAPDRKGWVCIQQGCN